MNPCSLDQDLVPILAHRIHITPRQLWDNNTEYQDGQGKLDRLSNWIHALIFIVQHNSTQCSQSS